jgi:hypothetical protein
LSFSYPFVRVGYILARCPNLPDHFRTVLARCTLDVFDDLLAWDLHCLSHRPLLGGYDEQQTLS